MSFLVKKFKFFILNGIVQAILKFLIFCLVGKKIEHSFKRTHSYWDGYPEEEKAFNRMLNEQNQASYCGTPPEGDDFEDDLELKVELVDSLYYYHCSSVGISADALSSFEKFWTLSDSFRFKTSDFAKKIGSLETDMEDEIVINMLKEFELLKNPLAFEGSRSKNSDIKILNDLWDKKLLSTTIFRVGIYLALGEDPTIADLSSCIKK